jgi:hypothetical protein
VARPLGDIKTSKAIERHPLWPPKLADAGRN